ncbi:MAG: helix-turn-helix domain-containing protein [Planctomycetota bacterium]|jgi:excisionase family DNA binding protein
MQEYFTIDEVADKLMVSHVTIRRLIKDGELESFKVGNRYRITQEQIDTYLSQGTSDEARNATTS